MYLMILEAFTASSFESSFFKQYKITELILTKHAEIPTNEFTRRLRVHRNNKEFTTQRLTWLSNELEPHILRQFKFLLIIFSICTTRRIRCVVLFVRCCRGLRLLEQLLLRLQTLFLRVCRGLALAQENLRWFQTGHLPNRIELLNHDHGISALSWTHLELKIRVDTRTIYVDIHFFMTNDNKYVVHLLVHARVVVWYNDLNLRLFS